MAERYYSPDEVAKMFNVSGMVVRKWLREGKLRGIKLGDKLWRVLEADIEAFVKNGTKHRGNINAK